MDSNGVSYMCFFILVLILIVFRCVVASMGLLFFDGFHCCFVHENFYVGMDSNRVSMC